LIWVAAILGLLFLIVHRNLCAVFRQSGGVCGQCVARCRGSPTRAYSQALAGRATVSLDYGGRDVHAAVHRLPSKLGVQFDWVTYHWIAGAVLTVSIVFHVIHASFWLDFWSIWPDKADLEDAARRIRRFIGRPAPPPRRFAKYPLENKLYHGAIIAAAYRRSSPACS